MIRIINTTTIPYIFGEIILQPGINFVERFRFEVSILNNDENNRTFKTYQQEGKLKLDV